ncbi:hypothetical protein HMPREF0080_01528 [Anaeroglobus geminatus F0357]|uniref:Uncharacterized protein n=1 Tax=Anaeroglobus geminatus F0357 TaxID=861450 RepID=G9YIN4_9FIRM|nr:hypothetical protein HMPREF0080_01528 [Anaeroglobus geminatus F0357]
MHSSYSYSNQSFESKKTAHTGGLFARILQKYDRREKRHACGTYAVRKVSTYTGDDKLCKNSCIKGDKPVTEIT